MGYKKLALLAPCHGLEDFPLYHTGVDAASLLASWTALWHPWFIHHAENLPHVERVDYPPEDLQDALLLVPTPCEGEMATELAEQAEAQNATLLVGYSDRAELLEAALQRHRADMPSLDPELVKDFLAFGFAFLQVELLTQQMRYASSIDQTRIARLLKEAASAAISQDAATCREKLTAGHDALADERSHYYPVDVYLLDLTMVASAPATWGPALEQTLKETCPTNILISGQDVDRLAAEDAPAFSLLREGIAAQRVGLAGGEWEERALPLLDFEAVVDQLKRGTASYVRHLDIVPHAFARRRSGLFPALVYCLRAAGYQHALHMKYDEGHYPEGSQSKTRWQVDDHRGIDAFARNPLDAGAHETFLNLPAQLSDTMDTDHVAARMFLRWPGHHAPWYDDLRRCHRYGTALGKFVTLEEFFSAAGETGTSERFAADDYRYPFLRQIVSRGEDAPLSRWTRFWQPAARDVRESGLAALAALAGAEPGEGENTAAALSRQLCDASGQGTTVFNPFCFPRRVLVESADAQPPGGTQVYAAEVVEGRCLTLLDVPAMGFASCQRGVTPPTLKGPLLAEEWTLQNEFMQAVFDPHTGALRSLKDYRSRTPRLSQQLGVRISMPKTGQPWVDRQAPVGYSVMAADAMEITQNGRVLAEITSRGRLLAPNGERVGGFEQRAILVRGSRVLELQITLDVEEELLLMDDPWDSYYACRFAFGDEAAVLRAGTRWQSHDVSRRRIEAPLFVDIDHGAQRTTILTGGLPFHRRAADAQLDTLLALPRETQRSFRLGIGVDLPSSVRAALEFLDEDAPACGEGVPANEQGWLWHVDARNVLVTQWKWLADGQLSLRVLETEGRPAKANLRCCRPISAAWHTDFALAQGEAIETQDGVVRLELAGYEVADIVLDCAAR